MKLKDIIKNYRKEHKLSYRQFAEQTSGLSHTYISKIEKEEDIDLGFKTLKSLANAMNMTLKELLELTDQNFHLSAADELKYPIHEKIETFTINKEDNLEYIETPQDYKRKTQDFFAGKLKGDSMFPQYNEEDIIIFRRCNYYNNGDYVCISIGNNNPIFRKIIKHDSGITLQSLNYAYDIKMYSNEDVKNLPIRILGVAVEMRRKL